MQCEARQPVSLRAGYPENDSVTINWERESGDRIEEFLAAHLLLQAGRGNQIRPSQGDHGIDVQIPTDQGWDIYQIKRFATNLDSSAKQQIKKSWNRFKDDVLPGRTVRSWSLVLPLEPTPQNETWLEELTQGSEIEIRWIGRALLDGWAADNPRLTDYFFGDGGRRLHELMALAFSGARPPADDEGEPLLTSIQDRMRDLNRALDEVDPFYRYEIEVRSGDFSELPSFESQHESARPGLVESVMEQIDEHQYLVTHIIARSEVSTQLRPILGTYNFTAETPEQLEALERWFHYGSPLSDASGTVVRSEGPPGTTLSPGSVATAWTISPVRDDQLPPLEARLCDNTGAVLMVVPVTAATSSSGVRGNGQWLRAQLGPAAAIEYFVGSADREDSITITADRAVGAEPDAVLPTLELVANLPGNLLELTVRNGPPFMPPRDFSDNEISAAAIHYGRFVNALAIVQRHTYSRVTIPDITNQGSAEVQNFLRLSALLDGQEITGTFTQREINDDSFFAEWDDSERALITEGPITIQFAGAVWDTNMNQRQEFESVWLDRSVGPPILRAGQSSHVRSIAVARTRGN